MTLSYVRWTWLVLLLLSAHLSAFAPLASARIYISVGPAKQKKAVLAYAPPKTEGMLAEGAAKNIGEIFKKDLEFLGSFTFLDKSAFIENSKAAGITFGSFKFTDWSSIGADYLIKTAFTADEGKSLVLEARLYDLYNSKEVLAKRYPVTLKDAKTLGHTLANDVLEVLAGQKGFFLSKIAMSCDLTGKKEIYVMNFDGSDAKQVTTHKSIAFGPAWSPDGSKIAYSLFTKHKNNLKNIDLYEYNFQNSTLRLLSDRKGINSGPAYSPDGSKLAVTLSFKGTPQIFTLDLTSGLLKQLTRSGSLDVDASWSRDGSKIAFVSSRVGMPMIFGMSSDGSNIQRLTFAGRYNASPSWSPTGKIAFAGWIDGHFEIFTMNADGTTIERLTKNQGNNEDPSFSPDGNFIAFSSNRSGQRNIYVMSSDGTGVKRLTYGLGNCVSPKWSNNIRSIASTSP